MIVVVSTENFGDFKGFPVLNAFQETLILDTVYISYPVSVVQTEEVRISSEFFQDDSGFRMTWRALSRPSKRKKRRGAKSKRSS